MTRKPVLAGIIIGLLALNLILRLFPQFDEAQVSSRSNLSTVVKPAVAILPIIGAIKGASASDFMPSGIEGISLSLERLAKNKSVKAVVLRVNSPGGTVGASQELFQAVEAFKKTSKKPVVVSILDVGASGAYWVSLAADKILANPGSMVGSLGVITQSPDFTQIYERYGIGNRTFKAGKHKDLLNPWRKLNHEEEVIIQTMLDDIHHQFMSALVKKRGFSKKKAQKLADGRIFTGLQAKQKGLIDGVGNLSDAINLAAQLGGISGKPRVLNYSANPFNQFFSGLKSMFQAQKLQSFFSLNEPYQIR